ncbi:secretin N-terminal domain-containing protein [Shimwellia blattae]|uniref:Protein transport protein HofQ n=1 Tax=Shimwellia blattae (strain ATCC 29907 / DSM 4481 / JCM 1650 / NBRC 105725 / CDC 9005-74) TaxID=630626 RepID=I2B4C0_SHIBC|nr:secretin N-terminal domain-containing protein [Shimwellia blattae]AFJ45374.1 protein transport protein HofQ precursor [Shimwellia blattae DSM 4481 = NBRC 105725]GAB82861.1 putative DNA utilization protein HofQ [Shimwellia blattae DSM 4481 = NBRC 105725]VDY62856.1 Type IV pilus biogenesis and competence protein pilQ precursor [Shimwellia blattae]VEC19766.1 Type IV pilus biogenesis and competence protein pilQ precursor [Shimwellia blattae]
MRTVLLLLALLWPLITGAGEAGGKSSLPQQPVSLMLDNVPAGQVLQSLARQAQLNIVVAPGVSGALSLQLAAVPWAQALEIVAAALDVRWSLRGNVLQITPASRAREQARYPPRQAPLGSATLGLRHASAADLAAALTGGGARYLSPRGSVLADVRTNRLLVQDTRPALEALRHWVETMDVPLPQVELVAHIVSIGQESLRDLGVKWAASAGGGTLQAELPATAASTRLGFNIGRISGRMLELELSALERRQQLAIIASPRLLTSHQQPASIRQGSEIPYLLTSGENGNVSVDYKEALLGMTVTPYVYSPERIRLKLHISQNMPGQKLQYAQGEVLTIDKQEIETEVVLRDGETIALGGIFQDKRQQARGQVPWLGGVPLLGGLFRHEAKNRQRQELVVFITPRLLNGR